MTAKADVPLPASVPRPPFGPSALRWVASLANSWLHFVPLLVVRPFSSRMAWGIFRNWTHISYRIFGITLSLRDDNDGDHGRRPQLYVMLNQSSLAEALVSTLLLPPHYTIINLEYAAMPLIGWARMLLGDLVIVRQWKRQAKRGIERAAARLAAGDAWMISIEGARSRDGSLSPYKKGPVVMALQSQATIIPMVFHGGRDGMPRGEWRPRPGHIELHLLESIATRGRTYDDRHAVMGKLCELAEREVGNSRKPTIQADGPGATHSQEQP